MDSHRRVERMRGASSLEDGRSFYSASHLPSCFPAYSAQTSAKCVLTHPDTGSLCLPTLGPASEFIPPQHQSHCACLPQKGPCCHQSVLLQAGSSRARLSTPSCACNSPACLCSPSSRGLSSLLPIPCFLFHATNMHVYLMFHIHV